MKLELLLTVWIIILLFIIIILIYLDITKQYDLLNIILKYVSNIISLSIFVYIIFYKNNFKLGSNSSGIKNNEIKNDEIITNPYSTDKNTKYEDITVKELLEVNIAKIKTEIEDLKKNLNNIVSENQILFNRLKKLNEVNEVNKNSYWIDKLNNEINENNKKIKNLDNDIIQKNIKLNKYKTDYNSFLPTLVNKFLGKLKNKTIDGHIYGQFPPSSGYGQF